MTVSTEALEILRIKLPRGYQRMVVKRLKGKYSQPFVHMVAHGKRSNEEVLNELISLARQRKTQRSRIERAIASI